MIRSNRLTPVLLALAALVLSGCQSSQEVAPWETPKVTYNSQYDFELKNIFKMARLGRWEEATAEADKLHQQHPDDPTIERVHNWLLQEGPARREKAVEDEIRTVSTQGSAFHTTPKSLATDRKERGLPPRPDLRNAIEQIESTPYVPENFGKTIEQEGPMFDLDADKGPMSAILDKEISIHLDAVTLESIIFNVGQANGINFVADRSLPAFQQKLSVNLDQVKLSEFLRYISRNLGLQFQIGENLVWIVDGKDPAKVLEQTRFYRLRKGFIIPAQFGPVDVTAVTVVNPQNVKTTTETQKVDRFVNDGAPTAPALISAITNFFTGSKYMIDYERNLVVARGTPEQLEVMEKIIENFDRPIQQVLIEARFVTVSRSAFLQLGASWETGRNPLTVPPRTPTDYTGLGSDIGAVGLGLQETWYKVFNSDDLSVTLTALEQNGESQTLAAPRLTVINNLPARISDGKVQYYYEEYQVKQTIYERGSSSSFVPAGKPAKLTSGVSFDVLASIGGDGHSIMLALRPQVHTDVKLVTFATLTDLDPAGNVISTFDIRLPESRTQDLSTRVVVQSGQTVAMGGVLAREQLTYVESVPLLGDLPFIGAAFRKRTDKDSPRYLLVFVTATLLAESGEFVTVKDPS